jgi:hypothetical protein
VVLFCVGVMDGDGEVSVVGEMVSQEIAELPSMFTFPMARAARCYRGTSSVSDFGTTFFGTSHRPNSNPPRQGYRYQQHVYLIAP